MKVLVIRFSSIGDIVLCSPIVRAIKEQLGAEVHFLTKQAYRTVLVANPNIDTVINFREDLKEVKERLIQNNYDYIVDLHNNIRSKLVKRWLRKPSGSFPKLNVEKWLLVNLKINKLPDIHIVDRYFKAASGLVGLSNDHKGLDYYIPKEEEIDISLYDYGVLKGKDFVTLVLGATYYTKRIPKEKAIGIAKNIQQPVVLIGGPEEAALGKEIAAQAENVINTCGTMTLNQSASMIKQSKLVISGDTGMMHIAAAFKKPIAVLWGNTVPAFGMGPYMTEHFDFEVKGLSCRPCSKLGHHECPKGHFRCMMDSDLNSLPRLK